MIFRFSGTGEMILLETFFTKKLLILLFVEKFLPSSKIISISEGYKINFPFSNMQYFKCCSIHILTQIFLEGEHTVKESVANEPREIKIKNSRRMFFFIITIYIEKGFLKSILSLKTKILLFQLCALVLKMAKYKAQITLQIKQSIKSL